MTSSDPQREDPALAAGGPGLAAEPHAPPAPPSAIDPDGRPVLGAFRGTLADVGLERWASPWQQAMRRKRWQYVAILSKEIIAGAAVVDVGYISVAFVLVWERDTRRWLEAETMAPLGLGRSIDGGPCEGTLDFALGSTHVRHVNSREGHVVTARLNIRGAPVEFDWRLLGGLASPERLACVSRLAGGGINVTQKAVCVPVDGQVVIDGRSRPISRDHQMALVDWTSGYPAYQTDWHWAIGAGRLADGRAVGFNLCVGYNDLDHTENAVWLDGTLHRVGPVLFTIPPEGPSAVWRVRSREGTLDLTFSPEAVRAADTNFGLVASRYRQPVGVFAGVLPDGRGGTVSVSELPGLAEEHHARW